MEYYTRTKNKYPLKTRMKKHSIRPVVLARQAKISITHLTRILNGQRNPSEKVAGRIIKAVEAMAKY